MAVIERIIREHQNHINVRGGEVLSDVVMGKDYLQIRTYSMGDHDRQNGSKQKFS